ncbi:MAG: glycosyltransferase family 4 protein [Winogradskyella sp.]|uniref:glycosyltransferase family 4 protein n=1 Tax=Winogradskyella sp. TaxID=1883156 RepID=UPI0025D0A879|nr:glycosyltransferase family 1 protein [Winogradskyella sp.]NRB82847.1 glycosyltransferase family 4 protein [Winogradskyella sp.]
MRIGIEAQRLFRPHKHGMDRVALELIRSLQKIDKENEYFIFVKPDVDNKVVFSTDNFHIVEIEGGAYPIWEQFKLPKLAKAHNCDILHCTSNTAPLALQMPLVTTLHDVIFKEGSVLEQLTSSASWYQKIGNLYRRLIVNSIVKKSQRLITVSNFERQNISKIYKLDSSKIQTVHNGVNECFKAVVDNKARAKVKQKYNLPEHFLLHLGNTDPRKNTARVLKAFYMYIYVYTEDLKLVLVGLNESKLSTILKSIDLEEELSDKIILTGYVVDTDLPILFSLSELFLFPSLREGFGIPIIEAMACGTPVITSNTSSMPEVAGDAACLVNPNSTENIYEAIAKVRSDKNYKNQLTEKGLARYTKFTWENAARQVLGIYQTFNHNNI